MPLPTSFTYALTPAQQKALRRVLAGGNYCPVEVPHATLAVQAPDCRVSLYRSGKCLVQGKGAAEFVTFVLEPAVLQEARLGYEDLLDPSAASPHIGVDESGKGDFFGPLVVAGAYVDESLAPRLRAMNVRDSKRVTSDRRAHEMARDLRALLGQRFTLVTIGPLAYNRLYARMRNVNAILSWGHARAIENLLHALPHCPRAVLDQFGNPRQVERALMTKGRAIEVVQRPRAETDLAVAAASLLARAAFLQALGKLEERFGVPFPKGAGGAVREAAAGFVRRHAPAGLLEAAKTHFRTTDEVLSHLGLSRDVLGPDGAATSRPRRSAAG